MENQNRYIIAVDGGGTKTIAVLANLNGKIIVKSIVGSSNIDKIGFSYAMENLLNVIKMVFQKPEISFIYVALAGGTQRDLKRRKQVAEYIAQKLNFSSKKILVESDDAAAFWSGTDKKKGIVVIAGTGSVVVGWGNDQKIVFGGWGHLWGDQGSAFWIGKKTLQLISSSIDKNYSSLLKTEVFKKLKISESGDLMKVIYTENSVKKIASLSSCVDKIAVNQKDNLAINILEKAADKLIEQAIYVIENINLSKGFPLVLVGGVFSSKIILDRFQEKIRKINENCKFIRPKIKPIIGAVKLAIENYNIKLEK